MHAVGCLRCGPMGPRRDASILTALGSIIPIHARQAGTREMTSLHSMHRSSGSEVSGTPKAWGLNNRGQLGTGDRANSNVPLSALHLTDVVSVAAGDNFSLALRRDGTVWAWGDDDYGQLGRTAPNCGVPHATYACITVPRQVPGLTDVLAIAASGWTSLALRKDGTVWAWGNNGFGQMGRDYLGGCVSMDTGSCLVRPAPIPGLRHIIAIALSNDTIMALDREGNIWAAGGSVENNGWSGGDPIREQHIAHAVSIAECAYDEMALTSDGAVWVWGDNTSGQLGLGTADGGAHPRATRVRHLTDAIGIACGSDAMLALRRDGTVVTWGVVDYTPNAPLRALPEPIPQLRDVMALAGNNGWHDMALTRDGAIWTWGRNQFGELGIGVSGGERMTPVRVRGIAHVIALAAHRLEGVGLQIEALIGCRDPGVPYEHGGIPSPVICWRRCTTKPTSWRWLWYVDFIDQFYVRWRASPGAEEGCPRDGQGVPQKRAFFCTPLRTPTLVL